MVADNAQRRGVKQLMLKDWLSRGEPKGNWVWIYTYASFSEEKQPIVVATTVQPERVRFEVNHPLYKNFVFYK